jgi:Na+:H+ antiporter, NhaA family
MSAKKNAAPMQGLGVLRPLQEFLRLEAAGGLVLMGAAALALIAANSQLASLYAGLLDVPVRVQVGFFELAKPLLLWINDGLMAVFFFLVGLELKREVVEGHLSTLRKASLPAFAAAGGMLVPAAIYAAFNWGDASAMRGWAIPTATDIAFALGVLSLLGPRVPAALKAILLSVAIFDDLGAILVIAIFYTAELSSLALGTAALLVGVLALLNRAGVMRPAAYFVVGIPLWIAVLKSGVHATLAGVVLAMFIPIRAAGSASTDSNPSPLHHLEHSLHPWVAFGVLPIFAFANAGVALGGYRHGEHRAPRAYGYREWTVRREADRGARVELARGASRLRLTPRRHPLVARARRGIAVRHRIHDEPLHRIARVRAGSDGVSRPGAPRHSDRDAPGGADGVRRAACHVRRRSSGGC